MTLHPHLNHRVLKEHSVTAEAAITAHHRSGPSAALLHLALLTAGLTAPPTDVQSHWALRQAQALAEGRGDRGGNLQVLAGCAVVLGLQWEGEEGLCVHKTGATSELAGRRGEEKEE